MSKRKDAILKENATQAIIIADTFEDEFVPISLNTPLSLFPVVNKPLIDYTLEFLSLGGVEETFLFCSNHVAEVKAHINKSIKETVGWSLTMKVHIIVSESCHSFGDCLRDLDAKGFLRGDFVLLEPGVISNISLLPLLKKHGETCVQDKGAAMTVIYQECAPGHRSLCPEDETIVVVDSKNRVLFQKKSGKNPEKKVAFPLEIFLENHSVSVHHNIKDTHIAICSSSVLPLFSDNFDFQTKDDFVRGLLMNEEILGSTVYCNILKGSDYGGSIHNWRTYQSISMELKNRWIYPLLPSFKRNRMVSEDSAVSTSSNVSLTATLCRSILGPRVTVGENVKIHDAFVFEDVTIEDDVIITLSVLGPGCVIKKGARVTVGSVLGKGVVIEADSFIENSLIQATESEHALARPEDKISEKAYRLRADEEEEEDLKLDKLMARRMSRLHIHNVAVESEYESEDTLSDSETGLSYSDSPPPDDTKLFYNEVLDSLNRGYSDKLACDNLILEINSSRYAYNVTVNEVNFNVIKAIMMMSQTLQFTGQKFLVQFSHLLSYFIPLFKNYIKNEAAMEDCLQAIQEVALSSQNLKGKWVLFVLKYLYEKEYLSEEAILSWFKSMDQNLSLYAEVKPFAEWLEEAEEESDESD